MKLRCLVGVAAVLIIGTAPTHAAPVPQKPDGDATSAASGDFNGDGFDDLVVGVPWEDIGGKKDAGGVSVMYGSAGGLSATNDQFWHQGTPGVPGEPEPNDHFGWALTTGDFDKDGYDDLAIGVPFENVTYGSDCGPIFGCENEANDVDAGYVVVLYGSASGLSKSGSEGWARNSNGVQGESLGRQYFGWALAGGDFDGDGFDDLGIGAPGVNGGWGAVHVLFGRSSGLGASRDQVWQQRDTGFDKSFEQSDWFGSSLAAGNLGYSTKEDDLAIGVPGEDFGSRINAGAVRVLFGQPGKGLSTTLVPDLFLHEDVEGVEDDVEGHDRFGWALAIGDFGVTAQQDLAVGVPGESAGFSRQGAVHVFYGGSYGPSGANDQIWHEGTPGVEGDPESGDEFGRSLAVADFDAFSQADLAIGSPLEDVGSFADAGAVHVIHGGPAGLSVTGSAAIPDQLWTRSGTALGTSAAGELFGFALAAGVFGNGPGADLGIMAPGVAQADNAGVGAAHILYGSDPNGLRATGAQLWHQDSPGIEDQAESGDRFGG
jgi:hypothetical protein